jgi:hypothetical protein
VIDVPLPNSTGGTDAIIKTIQVDDKSSPSKLVDTASNVLNLNGIPFHGGELKISRPAKYEEFQTQPSTHTTWKQGMTAPLL